MLRKTRILLAALFIVGITLLFTGIGTDWWGWMAKLQFLPAVLGLNIAVIAGVLAVTLIMGRIYCSVVCPLGVFQDIIIWLRRVYSKLTKKAYAKAHKKSPAKHFVYHKERKWLRYGVLALIVICIAAGIQGVVLLVAPYSAYGRMVAVAAGKSLAWPLIAVAGVTFVGLLVLSWIYGRAWCSNVCPVGTALGLVSRFAMFRIGIDQEKCVECRKCERECRAGCIDIAGGKVIDHSRCVDCFDCIGVCDAGGIKLRWAWGRKGAASTGLSQKTKPLGQSPSPQDNEPSDRRDFIGKTAVLAGGLALTSLEAKAQLHGGFAPITPKQDPERETPLVPPGAESVKRFYDRCTGCQLCVSNCPNGVLKTSTDLGHLLQPRMSYADGYCRPECNVCGTVCPAGAIEPLAKFEKLAVSWGVAHVYHKDCLQRQGTDCLNCVRHCPVGAIRVVTNRAGRQMPVVDEELCIGCGACENLCPVRPISAVRVNGRSKHVRHDG
ncbi:MAG: 4Fe-4S dicluster domain-containing protein [Bacteroidales bacterium]|nr:4Fe-4S dicluster domain-containing protein [Bacteroidales bacterium]